MKKILSFGFVALILCSPISAMGSKDVDMSSEQQPAAAAAAPSTFDMRALQTTVAGSAFDMSSLQTAIDDVAYNNPISHLPYFDYTWPSHGQDKSFSGEIFRRYSALQSDLIQLQQTMSPEDFKQTFDEVNKAITSLMSSEDALKFTYLTVTHKFNSEKDLTPEILKEVMGYVKCIVPGLEISAELTPEDQVMLKSICYKAIKARQEKREVFYKLLLTNKRLNDEYQAILSGQIIALSEEFLHEFISSLVDIIKKAILITAQVASQEMHKDLSQSDHAEIEALITQITPQITTDVTAKRASLYLMLKHFGEISGFGLI